VSGAANGYMILINIGYERDSYLDKAMIKAIVLFELNDW